MSPASGPPVPILDLTRYDEDLKAEIGRRVAEVFAGVQCAVEEVLKLLKS